MRHQIPTKAANSGLASKILIGLGLGVLTGLFFGELTAHLQIVSRAYLRLMQMTVIPYVAVALITGLGKLELYQAKKLAVRLGILVLFFWAVAFVVIVLLPQTFPEWRVGSFFSTSLVEPKKTFKFIELYIPTNPFHALANGIVPGIVFFSVGIGVALIGIKKKEFEKFSPGINANMVRIETLRDFFDKKVPEGRGDFFCCQVDIFYFMLE